MLAFSIVMLVILLVVGLVGWTWRIKLMLNEPEKYRQLREFEKEYGEQRDKSIGKAINGGLGIAAKILRK